jgi:hypothetical protein
MIGLFVATMAFAHSASEYNSAEVYPLPRARLPAAANADLHGQLQDGALAGAYPAGGAGNGSENGKYRIPGDWPYHAKRMLPISESRAIAA